MGYRSFKVIKTGIIRKLEYGFLFAFHSSYGLILYRFRDKARHWLKWRFFRTPAFDSPLGGTNRNIAITLGVEKLEWCDYPMARNG